MAISTGGHVTKITKLYLNGFKSFAQKTELVFGPTFNCVLGPNGSGKSNIMDSLCFVLGKSSSKSMRADKTANLIYNGGKSKNPAKQATVKIFFNNESRLFPIEDDEVVIGRTVKQNGSSVYKINDKKVTSVDDAQNIIRNQSRSEPLRIELINADGEKERYNFR